MKYTVIIEETVTESVTVEADSILDAERLVRKKYFDGKYIVAPGHLTNVQFKTVEE